MIRGGADQDLPGRAAVSGLPGGEGAVFEVAVAGLGTPTEVVERAAVRTVVERRHELGDVSQLLSTGKHVADRLAKDVARDEVGILRACDAEQFR